MYRISALTSEYNLTSNIIFNLVKDSMEELKDIELIKTKTNNLFGVQEKIEFKNTDNINIKKNNFSISISNQAIHFFAKDITSKDVIKFILKALYETSIFDRFGVEHKIEMAREELFNKQKIENYIGELRKNEIKDIRGYNYNKVTGYIISKNKVDNIVEFNTISFSEDIGLFVENIEEILGDM